MLMQAYCVTMKTADKQARTTIGACKKNRLDCTKSGTKKTAKQRQKTTGKNTIETTGQILPSRNQPSLLQTLVMQTSVQETLPGNSASVSRQYPQCSGKLKLQLFPIDEVTQKGLEKDKHNPYLELTLPTRKKISSVVKHLNVKWGSSESASGELMLFSYDAQLDNLVSYRRWTIKDSDTSAADVYATIGSPSIFRLRYGWFSNLELTACGRPLTCLHSEDNLQTQETHIFDATDERMPQCPTSSTENGPVCSDNTLNPGIGTPPVLDKSVQAVDKSALLSWADCLSNISVGALLSEASSIPDAPAPGSGLQQIPITCDSFDAAIASLIACHQTKAQSTQVPHPSIWDAEETCHAFAFQKTTSLNNNDPASSRDAHIAAACTHKIISNSVRPNDTLGIQVVHAVSDGILQQPVTIQQLHIKDDAIPEPNPEYTVGLQPLTQGDASKELKTIAEPETEALHNNDLGRVDICWAQQPGSSGPSGCITSSSRQISGGDSTNLSTLFETSLDAFQNFSIF